MNILGLSAFYHDSAACLVTDGRIVAAAQEERFTRKKHDEAFPARAIEYCLSSAGLKISDVDLVVFYEKPFLKFERLLETYLACAPYGIRSFIKAMPVWLKRKLWIKDIIASELGYSGKVLFPEHHESHAASAFFPSPFEHAAVLTLDGVGEWATSSLSEGKGNQLRILQEIRFPHSLGLLYSAFTYYTGFKVNSGEYKVMGLAPYGEPRYKDLILEKLMDLKADGSFKLDLSYFDYCAGLRMTNDRFHRLFGGPPRKPETRLTQREMDLARSVQEVTEEVMVRMARHARQVTGARNLCLAGGVALNCVGNGRILRERIFDRLWIQPAAGDAGGALGAALAAWHTYLGSPRSASGSGDVIQGSYLGPSYSDEEIGRYLDQEGIPSRRLDEDKLARTVAEILASAKVVGWFQGRMEFGPRALGSRSILGDARSPKMQETMNLKIKFRESFRPFAPAVLREKVSEYFEMDADSPYMLLVAPVREHLRRQMSPEESSRFGIDKLNVVRSSIPAVTHVDYSARIQTVDDRTHERFRRLLEAFEASQGCPVLINTSFNVRGEPLVCSPAEAYRCFMRTDMDYLVLGDRLLDKTEQKPLSGDTDWKREFELD
ncbi:MAG: nebramycin 5' synthase [Candidatus Omnitrophica bacterium]|nr:nebramycin 5' synthase [Candidatus Omnitrophota bacterium]